MSDEQSWWNEHGSIIVIVVAVFGIFAAWMLLDAKHDRDRIAHGPAQIESVLLTHAADGAEVLVLQEFIELHYEADDWKEWRLSALRIRDGVVTGRAIYGRKRPTCGVAPSKVWCITDEGDIDLRDGTSLVLVADKAKLLSGSADLADGQAKGQRTGVFAATGALELTSKQGYRIHIDPTTLAATRAEGGAAPAVPLGGRSSSGVPSAELSGHKLSFSGDGPRSTLASTTDGVVKPTEASFISPAFLADPFGQPYAGVQVDDAILIGHATSLDDHAALHISAIHENGEPLWDHIDRPGRFIGSHADGGVLAVMIGSPGDYVVGLDPKTGAERYRYDGPKRD